MTIGVPVEAEHERFVTRHEGVGSSDGNLMKCFFDREEHVAQKPEPVSLPAQNLEHRGRSLRKVRGERILIDIEADPGDDPTVLRVAV